MLTALGQQNCVVGETQVGQKFSTYVNSSIEEPTVRWFQIIVTVAVLQNQIVVNSLATGVCVS
jgi:hypothetical protein